ncbi:uncharacterized protein [Montipora capricornis]|uniref:uncharacterized protein n=1 Tax=Montipora capricornis TaxID=246305 RepID=UPI0035F1E32D
MKGLKFAETLRVKFEKEIGNEERVIKTAYFNSKSQTITNDTQIELSLSLSKQEILNNIAVWISEGSGWTIQSIDNHYLNVVKYEPIKGSCYIKLPTELRNSAKDLINMKNEDNECFRWCHIRYSNPQAKYPQRIKKSDKAFIQNLDYQGIEFPVTIKQINKIEKQNKININVFGYEEKQKYPIYVSKEKYEDHMNLLLITENENKHYVLIKDFNKFMYNQTKHKERKHFCMYRGSAHQDCNLNFRLTEKIPVIFHNLRGYDSHFIMQEIGEIVKEHKYTNKKGEKCQMNINAIPNNMEKYMAFMLGNHLTFIDSFQFMGSRLDKLVSNLPREAVVYNSQKFKGKELDLMTQKRVYPHDFMDSFDKFNEKLPPKEEFYRILNDEDITDDQYKHAQNVWNTFNLKNMGEYHDLYLKSDILLLADVFENFRKTCLQYYKLDPCHYFTSPGLSWDAMLKMTDIKLELMTNIDMFQFIEKGMRGGISYIANRYGKANNKYMKTYDEKAPSKYIMYLDANNLYGWAMSQYLPTGVFRWMTEKQIDNIDLAKYKEDSKKGLILEVAVAYPEELHDLHNDYPLGPEKKVNKDMLSNYCQEIADKFNVSTGLVHKLIPTLSNKEKYVLHYRNLQLYTDLGLKITKVHRVLEFNQSAWLEAIY